MEALKMLIFASKDSNRIDNSTFEILAFEARRDIPRELLDVGHDLTESVDSWPLNQELDTPALAAYVRKQISI